MSTKTIKVASVQPCDNELERSSEDESAQSDDELAHLNIDEQDECDDNEQERSVENEPEQSDENEPEQSDENEPEKSDENKSQLSNDNEPGQSQDNALNQEELDQPEENAPDKEIVTFKSLGVVDVLCEACERLNWKTPTLIQQEALPVALKGHDIIGLAETGSGKTAAFAIPVLQALLKSPQKLFALILTPTRELAYQISEQFDALGLAIGMKTAVIVGGLDITIQNIALSKKPHVIIATPGRLVDHLENTKGFNLRSLKFLVMDEADRILDMDFEQEMNKILKIIPRVRTTYLYSATMTQKVQKLQRASLNDPIKVEASRKYQTVAKLHQSYLFIPLKHKDIYLAHVLNELPGDSIIIFTATCVNTQRLAFLLRNLGFEAIPIHGKQLQAKRLGALQRFKSKNRSILIATDVASRGLDIPHVDVVINFDIPANPKDYIHRVGRTARAGRSGKSITFVTQYDVGLYQKIEMLIEKKLPVYPTVTEEVLVITDRVMEAQRFANMEMRKFDMYGRALKNKRRMAIDDSEESYGVRKRFRKSTPMQDNKGKKWKK